MDEGSNDEESALKLINDTSGHYGYKNTPLDMFGRHELSVFPDHTVTGYLVPALSTSLYDILAPGAFQQPFPEEEAAVYYFDRVWREGESIWMHVGPDVDDVHQNQSIADKVFFGESQSFRLFTSNWMFSVTSRHPYTRLLDFFSNAILLQPSRLVQRNDCMLHCRS